MTLDATLLPTVNALLNATTAALLVHGWWLIRRGERERHRVAMLGACVGSALFLISYLYYHFQVGSVRFAGHGAARTALSRRFSPATPCSPQRYRCWPS